MLILALWARLGDVSGGITSNLSLLLTSAEAAAKVASTVVVVSFGPAVPAGLVAPDLEAKGAEGRFGPTFG